MGAIREIMREVTMLASFSEYSIHPKHPVALIGKSSDYDFVHDPLKVHVALFRSKKRYAFISYDLIAVDQTFLDRFIQRLNDFHKSYTCYIGAIHTHNAPAGTLDTSSPESPLYGLDYIFGPRNDEYIDYVIDQTIKAVHEAEKNFQNYQVDKKAFLLQDIGKNRNNPNLKGDPRCIVFRFVSQRETNILFHFSCHPTVLKNNALSADLIGGIYEQLKKECRHVLFFNGDAGDISTRFTRKGTSFAEIKRLADRFMEQYLAVDFEPVKETGNLIESKTGIWEIPLREPQDFSKIRSVIRVQKQESQSRAGNRMSRGDARLIESKLEGLRFAYEYAKHYQNRRSLKLRISSIHFFGEKILTFPGEIFSELIRKYDKLKDVYIFGYTNGYSMYFPDQQSFEQEVYEARASFLNPGAGERLMDEVIDMFYS